MTLVEQLDTSVNFDNNGCDKHFYLWSKDKKGKYLSCNKTMYNAAGLSNESDILGLTDFDLCWEKCGNLFKKNDNIVMHERKANIFIEPSQDIFGKISNLHCHKQALFGQRKQVLGTTGWAIITTQQNSHFQPSIQQQTSHLYPLILINEKIYLSKRYSEIAKHIVLGKTSKEIAKIFNLSFRTIEYYIAIIKKKFNVKTKSQLIEKLLINILQ